MGQIKGLALISAVKALRSSRKAAQEVLDERMHHYLEEPIFPSRLYPEDDLLKLLEALASILPPRPDLWEWIGEEGARSDFTGTYAALIREGRPKQTLRLYPKIWRLYHDEGRAVVTELGDREVGIEIRGEILRHEGFVRVQSGHLAAIARLAGAKGVEVEAEGREDRRPAASWRVRWESVGEPEG